MTSNVSATGIAQDVRKAVNDGDAHLFPAASCSGIAIIPGVDDAMGIGEDSFTRLRGVYLDHLDKGGMILPKNPVFAEWAMAENDLLDLAEALRGADDPFGIFSRFAKAQGVQGFLYGFASLKVDLETLGYTKAAYFHHTYSAEWEAVVGPDGALNNDPSMASLENGAGCVVWYPQNRQEMRGQLTPQQRRQIEIEDDLGMIHGVSLRLADQRQSFSGIGLWVSDVSTDTEFLKEWDARSETLLAASNLLDVAVREERPNILIRLTARERDCLSWLARGLRPAEICWRLALSEKTFEKHILSAKMKLKSRTRDQALAKAVLLGLLHL